VSVRSDFSRLSLNIIAIAAAAAAAAVDGDTPHHNAMMTLKVLCINLH